MARHLLEALCVHCNHCVSWVVFASWLVNFKTAQTSSLEPAYLWMISFPGRVIFLNLFHWWQSLKHSGSSPGPSPRRFSQWRFVRRGAGKGWITWFKISQNLGDFLPRDLLRPKENCRQIWVRNLLENAETVCTRKWWLPRKVTGFLKA